MKYTFEPYREDGSPRKSGGMFRSPLYELTNLGGYLHCTCGMILQNYNQVVDHWNQGHFDKPLYEDDSIEFEDGVGNKIIPKTTVTPMYEERGQ